MPNKWRGLNKQSRWRRYLLTIAMDRQVVSTLNKFKNTTFHFTLNLIEEETQK